VQVNGQTLDIHTGGVELVFPHHENEIAQSEAITDQALARFWRADSRQLCYYAFMRTTMELPDPLFRRLKAAAALEGTSLKRIILRAVEKELESGQPGRRRIRFPLIRSKQPGVLSLTNPQIDDLLFG